MAIDFRKDMTVRELVVEHPESRRTLEELGVDYCCGGGRPLSDAAESAGVDWERLTAEVNDAVARVDQEGRNDRDWSEASATELATHIVDKHHAFMKRELPRIGGLFETVYQAHHERHGDMLEKLHQAFGGLREEIEMHLMKEEEILFPYVRDIEAHVNGNGPAPQVHCGTVQNPIRQMEHEHDNASAALGEMHRLTGDFTPPEDACETFRALYDALRQMETDLHEHIHLENNILFPRAIALEQQCCYT